MEIFGVINVVALVASVTAILGSVLSKYLTHKKEAKLTITIGGKKFVVTINNQKDIDRIVDQIQEASGPFVSRRSQHHEMCPARPFD